MYLGDVRLLEQMPIQGSQYLNEFLNDYQESPYHVITKNNYTQDCQLMRKVVNILIEKNFTASFRDKEDRLPIDYILQEHFDVLHDLLFKISSSKCYIRLLNKRNEMSVLNLIVNDSRHIISQMTVACNRSDRFLYS